MKSRRKYTPNFKGKVVIEALSGNETLASIAQKHELNPTQINLWKKEVLEKIPTLFSTPKSSKASQKSEGPNQDYLEQKIGQLTIELDFLKKNMESTSRHSTRHD